LNCGEVAAVEEEGLLLPTLVLPVAAEGPITNGFLKQANWELLLTW
jgi:hypothetical protein